MIREINHVGIRTADMAGALRLYRDLLGGRIIRDVWSVDGARHIVYVQLANGVVELIGGDWPPGTLLGLHHIAFMIGRDLDLQAATERVRAAGYAITIEPMPALSGVGHIAFFEDAAGCTYELIQREENIRIPDLQNEFISKFDHISIRVDNESAENTRHLVQDILGIHPGRNLQIGENFWQSYTMGGDSIGLFDSKDRPRPANPLALLVFDVKNCQRLFEHLTKNGIEATEPRPAGIGDFNLFFATGPDGERLEFIER